jgi:hypothetical protein
MARPTLTGQTRRMSRRQDGTLNSGDLIPLTPPGEYPAVHDWTELPLDAWGWHDLSAIVQADGLYEDARIIYCDPGYTGTGTARTYSIFDPALGGNGVDAKGDPFNPISIVPFTDRDSAINQLRFGFPDILLFKSGSVVQGSASRLATRLTGRQKNEPAILAVYGGTAQVAFRISSTWLNLSNHPGLTHKFVVIRDCIFHAVTKDPAEPEFRNDIDEVLAVRFQADTDTWLFENCTGKYTRWEFGSGEPLTAGGTSESTNITVRRTVIFESYSGQAGKKPSCLKPGIFNFCLDECVIDHGGWTESEAVPIRERNHWSHDIYQTQDQLSNALMRRCIVSRASANGFQWRSGANLIDNLMIDNPITGFSAQVNLEIAYNVVIGSAVTTDRVIVGGLGISAKVSPKAVDGVQQTARVHHNLVIKKPASGSRTSADAVAFANTDRNATGEDVPPISQSFNTVFEDNVTFEWATSGPCYSMLGVDWCKSAVVRRNRLSNPTGYVINLPSAFDGNVYSFSDNQYHTPGTTHFRLNGSNITFAQWVASTGDNSTFAPLSFTDASRDMTTYMAHIGESGGANEFCDLVRGQSRANWRTDLLPNVVNAYFRQGFDIEGPA